MTLPYDSPVCYDTPSYTYDGEDVVRRIAYAALRGVTDVLAARSLALCDVRRSGPAVVGDDLSRGVSIGDQSSRAAEISDVKVSSQVRL